jgi:hypothetical protein
LFIWTGGHVSHRVVNVMTVLTCTEVQYAILYRMLERCLKIMQNNVACFQELHLSFVRFDASVLLWSASA